MLKKSSSGVIANNSITPAKLKMTGGISVANDGDLFAYDETNNLFVPAKYVPSPKTKQYGSIIPAMTTNGYGYQGILAGTSGNGTSTNSNESIGRCKNIATSLTIGSNAGHSCSVYTANWLKFNPKMFLAFMLKNIGDIRFVCGMGSGDIRNSDTPATSSGYHYIEVIHSPIVAGTIALACGDGITDFQIPFSPTPTISVDVLYKLYINVYNNGQDIEAILTQGSNVYTASLNYLTAPIPANNQDLGFVWNVQQLNTIEAKNVKFFYCEMEHDTI